MEEGYDEELEKLLGEIPRATSAPPHLDELQAAHNYVPQHSSKPVSLVDAPSDEATLRQTMRHRPPLYTPYSEPVQTPPSMGTLAFEDLPPSSNPLSPLYGGLPSASYDKNKHPVSQSRHSVDLNFTHNGRIQPILPNDRTNPGLVAFSATKHEMTSTLLDSSQACAEQAKMRKSNASSSDECIGAGSTPGAVQSTSEPLCSTSCLPTSLQLLDPLSENGTECIDNELQNDLKNLALDGQQRAQSHGMRFVHGWQSPLEVQGVRQLPEQSAAMSESSVCNLTGAVSMQPGPQSSFANGAFLLPPSASFGPPYPSDLKLLYAQQMHEAAAQQQLEERVLCRQRIKEEFLLRQQKLQEQQARFYASLQSQPGIAYSRRHSGMQQHCPIQASSCMFDSVQQQHTSKATLGGGITPDRNKSTVGMWASPVMFPGEAHEASGCGYFLHGFCTRGNLCPFPHSGMKSNSLSASDDFMLPEASMTLKGPRNGLFIPSAIIPDSKKKNYLANGHASSHMLSNGTHLPSPNHLSCMSGGGSWKEMDHEVLQSVNSHHLMQHSPPPPKYTTLKEVEGHIYGIAKDQHGCRFLQRKFEEGVPEDVQKIFVEIIDHVVELMTDPFGNYLVQKLLEVCNEAQRIEILYKVTGKDQLVTISLNMHGTRAVQKLIETLDSEEQVKLVVASLKQGVVTLIKDLNGNHVVQRCLQRLSTEDSQFIFDAAASHCVEIATHRHGCCVLQRCVDFSSGQQRNRLVAEIAANALVLSQDPFGNYVVQYILDLGLTWAVVEIIAHLDGNFVHLAMQKFSSNVVEKCLKLAGEESKARIIKELMSSARLAQLLQDPFANYVVQSALMVSKGALHLGLVEAIRPHLPALRSSPYGKRILSRTSLKK